MKRKLERTNGIVPRTRGNAAVELNSRIRAGCRLVGLETADDEDGEAVLDMVSRVRGWGQVWYPRTPGGEKDPDVMEGPGELSRFLSKWFDSRFVGMAVLWNAGKDLKHPGVAAWLREIVKRKDAPEGVVVALGRKVLFPRGLQGSAYVVALSSHEGKKCSETE